MTFVQMAMETAADAKTFTQLLFDDAIAGALWYCDHNYGGIVIIIMVVL